MKKDTIDIFKGEICCISRFVKHKVDGIANDQKNEDWSLHLFLGGLAIMGWARVLGQWKDYAAARRRIY